MSNTGENERDLRKVLDMTRWLSLAVLLIHFYFYCYGFFKQYKLRTTLTDSILNNLAHTGLFTIVLKSKLIALALLGIALIGAKGKKDETIVFRNVFRTLMLGLILFFGSQLFLEWQQDMNLAAILYMLFTVLGYLLILGSGTRLSRLLYVNLKNDKFNEENETFPQEEKLLCNEFSINYTSKYQLGSTYRKSHINIINPFRGTIICGTPGSGKSWFIILPMIKQMIEKGYGLFIYDFKFDALSKPAYNWMLKNKSAYKNPPKFYAINFDDLKRSHRCNPIDPRNMHDITDAIESARTILLALNKQWVVKQGDFFVESPINFVTAIIWYLRKYGNGSFCTLPHVIELMQIKYEDLFPVLNTQPEIQVLLNPFITAFENDAIDQLEGQIASAKICMARLASPQLYWVLAGNDFTLDINNPLHPKIVCAGNNPEKQNIYSSVLSLFHTRMVKIINKPGMIKCGGIYDEFPTGYFDLMDSLIATGRSNQIAAVLGMQDLSQLRRDYGKDRADVLMNICGNIISGQVMGDTAKLLSDRFGKIIQKKESISINRNDTSHSQSFQLDLAVPPSKIAGLSSGEFVGMVADDPHNKIKQKIFHAQIVQNSESLNQEMQAFLELPEIYNLTNQEISDNYYQISQDIRNLIEQELFKLKVLEEDYEED